MNITAKAAIHAAYRQALELGQDHDTAVRAVAQALALSEDIVREVVA